MHDRLCVWAEHGRPTHEIILRMPNLALDPTRMMYIRFQDPVGDINPVHPRPLTLQKKSKSPSPVDIHWRSFTLASRNMLQ